MWLGHTGPESSNPCSGWQCWKLCGAIREDQGRRRHWDSRGSQSVSSRELGVAEPIDYEKTNFEDAVRDVDVVLETLGGDTQQRSWKVLKKGGMLVSIVQPPSPDEAAKRGAKSAMFGRQPNGGELTESPRSLLPEE